MEMLRRAALVGEIKVNVNGWGFNDGVGAQGEWISPDIIREWEKQKLITVKGVTGTITDKGERGEYTE